MKIHNPPGVAGPLAAYSHGVEAAPGARWLHVSGQVAVAPDGSTPEGIEAQADLAYRNLGAVLASAGMVPGDLVKVNVYLTRPEDIPALRAARDRFQGDARPASTLVVVQALARPEWRVEIEAVAARAPES
jgi:enamine deaminase RidA (YjgF/YER057c/UK114 family)